MTLNKQLLCVSLLLLSLPWAGCQYLQEMDAALRAEQRRTLQATASVIATALAQAPQTLDPHGSLTPRDTPHDTRAADTTVGVPAIYCHPLSAPVRADGYFGDWADDHREVPCTDYQPGGARPDVRYRCGLYRDQLAVAISVDDTTVIYNNPTRSLTDHGDRVILTTGERDYILTAVAPGRITPRYFRRPGVTYRESRLKAAWIDRDQGYQVEVAMPRDLARRRLGVRIIDETGIDTFTFGPQAGVERPPRYVYQSPATHAALTRFARSGTRLRLVDPRGWLTASVGSPQPDHPQTAHWLLRRLYRAVLNGDAEAHPPYPEGVDLSPRPEVTRALQGRPASHWYRDPRRAHHQLLSAAVPITDDGRVAAVLVAEQSSERTAVLTDRAFSRLFILSLSVLGITALALLSYASWLSWRIRRLSRATQRALDDPASLDRAFPRSNAGDEIGSLTRNYAELWRRIREYTEYLETLSRKLSHELRTPLAIIQSSLDNLANRPLDPTAQTFHQRAADGTQRLAGTLTAMSEARRVEESITHAEPEVVNLAALLRDVGAAYRDLYRDHRIRVEGCAPEPADPRVEAAPDLLVQMLDKLVDNAAGFCPAGGTITLTLAEDADTLTIAVSNDGPLLPETMQSQLFDNMVSVRPQDDDTVHLGLGLHIVRLIVDYHGGRIAARNRADAGGVVFSVHLPRTDAGPQRKTPGPGRASESDRDTER